MKWFLELCSHIIRFNKKRVKSISFGANIRVTPNIDLEDVFAACREANFRFVNIGLESGSEKIHREVLKRHYSNEDIRRVVKSARRAGLAISFFNLIGIPGETMEEYLETVRMNRECQPDHHALSIFYPYPGTELYNLCRERGYLDQSVDMKLERNQTTLKLPTFSKWKIQWGYILFDYYVYKGKRRRMLVLGATVCRWLRSKPKLWSAWRKIPRNGILRWWRRTIAKEITK